MSTQKFINDDRENNLFQVRREVFTSEEVLQKEREEIFNKAWIYVGHETEIPNRNDFVTREVAGRPVIFNRDRSGNINVLLNTCPHRGASVCRHDSGNAKIFTCFYHGWAYRNSGELVNVPGKDDYANDPADIYHGLSTPPQVESYRGFHFVNFGKDVPDLETYLGDARYFIDLAADQSPEGMFVVEGTHKYSLQANWKLLVENSIDGYHAKSVHHTYFEMMMDLGSTPPMLGEESVNGISPAGMGTEFPNGHATLMYPANGLPLATQNVKDDLANLRAQAKEKFGESYENAMFGLARNSVFFPNFLMIDLSFGLAMRTMYPISPSETMVTSWLLAPKGVSSEFLEYRIDNSLTFWGPAGLATPDDVEALEQAQKAFSTRNEIEVSDISKGMGKEVPGAQDELQMRTWWREWNKRVVGEELPPEGTAFVPFQKQTAEA